MTLLVSALSLYAFSLLVAFLLRFVLKRSEEKGFVIPYDRLPIAIALVLLAMAAGVFASGNRVMANDFALMAYYLLILGVLLQIVNHIREQRARKPEEGGKDSGSEVKGEDHPAEDK